MYYRLNQVKLLFSKKNKKKNEKNERNELYKSKLKIKF